MTRLFVLATVLLMSSFAIAALPAPGSMPKEGDCPPDYVAKGNQCEPTAHAKFAIVKIEACPSAYEMHGNYCMATAGATLAFRRSAMSCPREFEAIGNYCIADK